MTDVPHPTRAEATGARENQERAAEAIPTSCAYCGEHHPVLDGPVSHNICDECSAFMERAADRDADDRMLVLMAVTEYGHGRVDCARSGHYDRAERAYTRVIRLLRQALDRKDEEITRLKRAAAEAETRR